MVATLKTIEFSFPKSLTTTRTPESAEKLIGKPIKLGKTIGTVTEAFLDDGAIHVKAEVDDDVDFGELL